MKGRHMEDNSRMGYNNGVRNYLFAPSIHFVLTFMCSSGAKPPSKLLALGKRVSFALSTTPLAN